LSNRFWADKRRDAHGRRVKAEGEEGSVGLHVDLGAAAHGLVVGHPAIIPEP
jgi:hypothetical protein